MTLRRRVGQRFGSASVVGLGSILALTGCGSGGVECSAIGWSNTLTISLDGDLADVADVKLCIDDDCVPDQNAEPPEALAQVALAEQDGNANSWKFTTGMSSPERFTVRVYDADGTVLTDADVTPEWVRVGGSEECGGPGEAALTVRV